MDSICFECEKKHTHSNVVDITKIKINKKDLLKSKEDLKNKIDEFKRRIDVIKEIFDKMINMIDTNYKIN